MILWICNNTGIGIFFLFFQLCLFVQKHTAMTRHQLVISIVQCSISQILVYPHIVCCHLAPLAVNFPALCNQHRLQEFPYRFIIDNIRIQALYIILQNPDTGNRLLKNNIRPLPRLIHRRSTCNVTCYKKGCQNYNDNHQ